MEQQSHNGSWLERARTALHNEWLGGLAVSAAFLVASAPVTASDSVNNSPVQTGESTVPLESGPHLIPAVQDGNPPKTPDLARESLFTRKAVDLGAQYVRVFVYPKEVLRRHPNFVSADQQVDGAFLAG